jgi:hypothetical protein
MRVQGLVDATIRHLEFRIKRPEIEHRKLRVRVHECNCSDYVTALAKRLSVMMGETNRTFENPSDNFSVIVRFRQLHDIDFDYHQQVYLTEEHCYVEYETDDRVMMLFDCTTQLPSQSQLYHLVADNIDNLRL